VAVLVIQTPRTLVGYYFTHTCGHGGQHVGPVYVQPANLRVTSGLLSPETPLTWCRCNGGWVR
jgi:hypothetical protein